MPPLNNLFSLGSKKHYSLFNYPHRKASLGSWSIWPSSYRGHHLSLASASRVCQYPERGRRPQGRPRRRDPGGWRRAGQARDSPSGGALPHIAHHAFEGLCAVPEGADATVPVTLIRGRLRLPLRPAGHNPDTARRGVTSGPRPGPAAAPAPPPAPVPRPPPRRSPARQAPARRGRGVRKAGARARPQQEPPPLDTRGRCWTPRAAGHPEPPPSRLHCGAAGAGPSRGSARTAAAPPPFSPRCPGGERGGRPKPGARAPPPAQSRPGGPGAVTWWGSSCLPWLGYKRTPRVAAAAALFVNKEDNKPGGSGRGRREGGGGEGRAAELRSRRRIPRSLQLSGKLLPGPRDPRQPTSSRAGDFKRGQRGPALAGSSLTAAWGWPPQPPTPSPPLCPEPPASLGRPPSLSVRVIFCHPARSLGQGGPAFGGQLGSGPECAAAVSR